MVGVLYVEIKIKGIDREWQKYNEYLVLNFHLQKYWRESFSDTIRNRILRMPSFFLQKVWIW